MLTVIRTEDDRYLITDSKNIKSVIKQAKLDCVDLPNDFDDLDFEQYEGKYILIELHATIDGDKKL